MHLFYFLRCPATRRKALDFLQAAALNWSLGTPLFTDLPALSCYNAFDGLARNAVLLQIPAQLLESDDSMSLFIQTQNQENQGVSSSLPSHLAPTALQKTVKHHPWIDLLPFPKLRDNILQGLQSGQLDEDRLVDDLLCHFIDSAGTQTSSLIIWGNSWDMSGWELSQEFLAKWAFLFDGCREVLEATNHWRMQRSEMRLEYILN